MTRLTKTLTGPWTADDQRRLDRFLKEPEMTQDNRLRLLDAIRREGPDSDEAIECVDDGSTQAERDQLERLRLDSGARYDTAGRLIPRC